MLQPTWKVFLQVASTEHSVSICSDNTVDSLWIFMGKFLMGASCFALNKSGLLWENHLLLGMLWQHEKIAIFI